jgi:hypothetical protein
MADDRVHDALFRIELALRDIEEAADEYGGWPGEDDEAKTAVDLGTRLTGLGVACAIGGREYAESGERTW